MTGLTETSEVPMTKIVASPPADGRELRNDEKSSYSRGYKDAALDVYLVATGDLHSFEEDDPRIQFISTLLDQIETWRNKQKMMATKK